jgi:aryl-alcohol dehydrogenase-like predicted oxidoreductase
MLYTPTYTADIYNSDFPGHGSRLVCGTSGLGGVWGKVDEQESVDTMLFALENGITSFDTAPSYGNAEVWLGKALAQWSGTRPFVSTKIGRLKADTAFDARLDYSIEGMRNSMMRSLDLLQLESVDLLFLHEPQWVPLDRFAEIMELLFSFREAGYVKMLGIGGNPPPSFMPFVTAGYFSVISSFTKMDACNLSAFKEILPVTIPEKIFFYAASSLHFGLLGSRFAEFMANGNKGFEENISLQDIQTAGVVAELAKKNGMPLPEMAQRYLFSVQEASRVVMGARNLTEIEATVDYWKKGALPEPLFEEITRCILLHNPAA